MTADDTEVTRKLAPALEVRPDAISSDTVTATLAQWEALVAGATKGEWLTYTERRDDGSFRGGIGVERDTEIEVCETPHTSQGSADAEFIAAARTAMPALLGFVEDVRALHREYRVWRGSEDVTHPDRKGTCRECYAPVPCPTEQALTKRIGGEG